MILLSIIILPIRFPSPKYDFLPNSWQAERVPHLTSLLFFASRIWPLSLPFSLLSSTLLSSHKLFSARMICGSMNGMQSECLTSHSMLWTSSFSFSSVCLSISVFLVSLQRLSFLPMTCESMCGMPREYLISLSMLWTSNRPPPWTNSMK